GLCNSPQLAPPHGSSCWQVPHRLFSAPEIVIRLECRPCGVFSFFSWWSAPFQLLRVARGATPFSHGLPTTPRLPNTSRKKNVRTWLRQASQIRSSGRGPKLGGGPTTRTLQGTGSLVGFAAAD